MNINPVLKLINFQCTFCKTSLDIKEYGGVCRQCKTIFPMRNSSLDFMGPYSRVSCDREYFNEVITRIRKVLDIPEIADTEITAAIEASLERTGNHFIDAEIASLPLRFGMGAALGTVERPPLKRKRNKADITFTGNYVPDVIPKDRSISLSFRFRAENDLDTVGEKKVGLSYRWSRIEDNILQKLLNNVMVLLPGKNGITWLPVKVDAGREITVSMQIDTPPKAGMYNLTVYPVGASAAENVVLPLQAVDATEDVPISMESKDYGEDHLEGITFLQRHLSGRDQCLILEVASGVHPHLFSLAQEGHEILASDVCSNQMQLGAIFSKYKHAREIINRIGFASFDVLNPPLQNGQFDGVAMFAALHHFPEPAVVLSRLANLVKPGGFIAVLCEPCGPLTDSEAYLRDLNAGINEQVFSVAEYRKIFTASGLEELSIRNDNGSLKAILHV